MTTISGIYMYIVKVRYVVSLRKRSTRLKNQSIKKCRKPCLGGGFLFSLGIVFVFATFEEPVHGTEKLCDVFSVNQQRMFFEGTKVQRVGVRNGFEDL